MREIKFRGKRKDNGEWVYGDLLQEPNMCQGIYWIIGEGTISFKSKVKDIIDFIKEAYNEVNKNTIGQYTGLKDENGKEIYEGDIIEFYSHKNNGKQYNKISRTLGIVYWREQKSYDCEYNNKVLQENPSAFNMPTGFEVKIIYREKENYNSGSWSYFANCEVIGNIHDNPELIK